MIKTYSLILFLLWSINVFSQEEITVEKIWKTYDFYPQSGGGYSAMADGLSYTYQEKNNSIVKQSFEN